MKKILKKLKEAREVIEQSPLKKGGRNKHSQYDYYTPEQVEQLVSKACKATNTIVLCNLKADEYGLYQTLEFIDFDSDEKLNFEMRTKHGSITATNETQQMGGTDTYSERYIKMKVFQIKDNNLDLDNQDNRPQTTRTAQSTYQPKANQQFKQKQEDDNKAWINDEAFEKSIRALMEQGKVEMDTPEAEVLKILRSKYKVARKYEQQVKPTVEKIMLGE
jgi:hypothetical protein